MQEKSLSAKVLSVTKCEHSDNQCFPLRQSKVHKDHPSNSKSLYSLNSKLMGDGCFKFLYYLNAPNIGMGIENQFRKGIDKKLFISSISLAF